MTMEVINDKLYITAEATIVDTPDQLPREMAAAMDGKTNASFVWIAGRYVQAEQLNENGQFWSSEDLEVGQASVRYTPMNVLHRYDRPVGVLIETKMVHREREGAGKGALLPELQVLGALWGANFPELATKVREAHAAKRLWWSMECVAESKQCLTCDESFPWAASVHDVCSHLAENKNAPRRFVNPTFLGGALVFPPARPGWKDADISEVAMELTREYAERDSEADPVAVEWEQMMAWLVATE